MESNQGWYSLVIRPVVLGSAVLMMLFIIIMPIIFIFNSLQIASSKSFLLIPALIIVAFLIGSFSLNHRLPFVRMAASGFLTLSTEVYKDFLMQSARYFCHENNTSPFSKVVKLNINDEIAILGFQTNFNSKNNTIFIPTSPNPTSGFIVIASKDQIQETYITPDELLKYTITSGASNIAL